MGLAGSLMVQVFVQKRLKENISVQIQLVAQGPIKIISKFNLVYNYIT